MKICHYIRKCFRFLSQLANSGSLKRLNRRCLHDMISGKGLTLKFVSSLHSAIATLPGAWTSFSQRQSLSFHSQRTNSPGEECDDIWSQEAIDRCRDHQRSGYLRSERGHLEEGEHKNKGRSRKENLGTLVMNTFYLTVLPKLVGGGASACYSLENTFFTLLKSQYFSS